MIHSPRTMLDIVPQITHLFSKLSYIQNWIIRFAALDKMNYSSIFDTVPRTDFDTIPRNSALQCLIQFQGSEFDILPMDSI